MVRPSKIRKRVKLGVPKYRAGEVTEDGCELAYQGLTFVSPEGAALLLETGLNNAQSSQLLFPLLASQAPLFEETLDWLQFAYTAYRTGDYVAPASTVLVPSLVLKG